MKPLLLPYTSSARPVPASGGGHEAGRVLHFEVSNLHCSGCAARIEETFMSRIAGVRSAAFNLAAGRLRLEVDDALAEDTLPEALTRLADGIERGVRIRALTGNGSTFPAEAPAQPEEPSPLRRIIVCGVLFAVGLVLESCELSPRLHGLVIGLCFGLPYVLCGYAVLKEGLLSITRKDFFNEFTLMGGATLAAIVLGELPEAVGVMLFYSLVEYVQERAAGSSRRSVRALLAVRPSVAHCLESDGALRDVRPETLTPGVRVVVKPGEKVPLDGEVLAGQSCIDTAPLSGESMPVPVRPGSLVYAGTINQEGTLTVRVTARYEDSSVSRILEMVENAVARKAPTERFITRFARWYTPIVTLLAVLTALVPPLLGLGTFHDWIYRGLVLLVISCPCALIISIPLGYFGGIGAASHKGILVKGGSVLDALPHIRTVALDKTGTLTRGNFAVQQKFPAPGVTEEALMRAAAQAECRTNHPVARAIVASQPEAASPDVVSAKELAGKGVVTEIHEHGHTVCLLAGNATLLRDEGVRFVEPDGWHGTIVHVARDGHYLGAVTVDDAIRPESAGALAALRTMGKRIVMLTGDTPDNARRIAGQLGVDEVHAGLLPEGKAAELAQLGPASAVLFVGDGINDAPVLASAGVGVAMGGLGSEAAIETADAVILDDSPAKIPLLLRIASATRRIIWQNIVLSLGIKILVMVLGVAGMAGLWEAVFADVGVALLAVLNATRAARIC